jgi:hypothetical protein
MGAQPVSIAVCSLLIIAALVLGVGVPGGMVIRHVVQTLPLWAAVVLGFRRSRLTGWVALPSFVSWLCLMGLIWAYLLGISRIASGQFTPLEIAMTILVGAASLCGIVSFALFKSSIRVGMAAALFIAFAALQLLCLRVSFLPAIAHR